MAMGAAPIVQAQTVNEIHPESGAPGSTLRMFGNNLGSVTTVTIGGEAASISGSSSTRLAVQVPSGVEGLSEVQVGGKTASEPVFVVTNGSGTFTSVASRTGISNGAAAAADYDGDDTTEVVLSGAGGAQVYTPDGTGGIRTENAGLTTLTAGTVEFGDVDNDGDLDLLQTGEDLGTKQTILYQQDLNGDLLSVSTSLGNFSRSAADFGDVDQDGDLDLVLAGVTRDNVTLEDDTTTVVYTNDGTGSFSAADTLLGLQNGTVDLVDVNNDGNLELHLTGTDSTSTGRSVLYMNSGGTFTNRVSVGAPVKGGAVDYADVDGDGDQDFVVAGSVSGEATTELYRNTYVENGTVGFSYDSSEGQLAAVADGTVSFADVEGDGDPDLLITGTGTAQMSVNDGGGNFSAVTDGIAVVENSAVAFGGFNGDGKLDLFVHDGTVGTATFYRGVVPFDLTGSSPPRNAVGVAPTASIDLTFSKTVPDTVGLADSIVVRGTQSGPIEDDDGLVGAGDSQLTYTPAQGLSPGETVTVTVLGGLHADGGSTLDTADTFSYTVGASVGPAAFPTRSVVDETNVDGAISVATGDIDGDGNQDLVVGSLVSNTVRWYAGNGAGGFDGGTEVASGVNYPRDVALADLDRDGTLDVLVMEGGGESSDGDDIIRSHLNTNGDGSSFSTQDVATSSNDNLDDPRAIATGDLNGDGAPDVVVVSQDNNSVYAYRNDDAGSGAYTEVEIQGSGGGDPRAVDVADVNGDGALDVIVGSVSDDRISWFPNNGTGGFGAERVVAASGAINPRDVDAANLDDDARLEILVAQRGTEGDGDDGAVAWYDSTSSGWTANTIVSADSVLTAAPADLNADGRLDVVAGSVNGDSLIWYENLGGGVFTTGDPLDTGVNEVRDVLAADFDGDGSLDPAVAAFAENALQLYPNLEPLYVTGTAPSSSAPSVDSTADITVSFNQTLAAGTVSSSNVGVTSNQSGQVSGTLSESGNQLTFSPDGSLVPGARITVSLDSSITGGEGVSLGDPYTFTFRVQTGTGTGGFTAASAEIPGVREGDLDWGDFDGDGDLDLVVVGDSTYAPDDINDGMAAVYENTASGFAKVESMAGVKTGASAEWGDYDGDGVLDLVVSGYNAAQSPSYRTIVYHNGGNGAFDDSTSLAAGVQNSEVAWGDYDGDGDLDLAVAGTDLDSGEFTKIYRYDRASDTFTDINAGLLTVNRAGLDWGDYDQDGDLDLVVAGSDNGTPTTNLYRNDGDVDGDGTYEFAALPSGTTGLPVSMRASAQWGDSDRDGLLELLLTGDTGVGEPIIQVFEYNGDNVFTQEQDLTIGTSGRGVKGGEAVWGDYDGDRDLDLAAVGNNGFESETPAASVFDYDAGAGAYGEIGAGLTAVDTSAVSWGDFNGDGILDLAVTGVAGTGGGGLETTLYRQEPAPTPTAEAPDSVHIHAAELKGSVDLTGVTTRVYFALTAPSGGTALIPADTLTGTGTSTVRRLTPDTLQAQSTYEYTLVAATSADSVVSTPVSFTTEEPRMYVDAAATGADDGLSWANAFPTLQSALALARPGDAIWVAAGTYHPDEGPGFAPDTSVAHFALKEGVRIYGGFSGGETTRSGRRENGRVDPSKTVLSGDVDEDGTLSGNSYHVVVSPRGVGREARLDGLTITGGNARADGVEGSSFDVDGDEFPESDLGGGVYVNGRNGAVSTPTLAHVAVMNNRAEGAGGGLYLDAFEFGEASPELGNVIVAENRASRGGGLAIVAGAFSEGGGGTSDPLVANALFRDNQATGGSNGHGGAVFVRFEFGSAVTPRFVHTTMVNNDAGGDGGGLYTANLDYNGSADSVSVHNSIVWGNTAGGAGNQAYGSSTTQGAGIGFANSLVEGSGGSSTWTVAVGGDEGGNLDAAPLFADAAGADLRLNWASPVIEAGASTLVPGDSADVDNDGDVTEGLPVDQNGDPRAQGRQVDMGAYEGGAVPSGPTLYVDQGTGADSLAYGGDWGTPYRTLQAAMAAARNAKWASSGVPFREIRVAAGTYRPDEGPGLVAGDSSQSFTLLDSVAVYGGYPSGGGTRDPNPGTNGTVLSGEIGIPSDTIDNSQHVVRARSVGRTSILDGFTITRGNARGPGTTSVGGGLLLMWDEFSRVAPTLRNLRIKENFARSGAGLAMIAPPPLGDTEPIAGGVQTDEAQTQETGTGETAGAHPLFVNVDVVGNVAASGAGGMSLLVGSGTGAPAFQNIRLLGNEAEQAAAFGVQVFPNATAAPEMTNVLVSGNRASTDSAAVVFMTDTDGTLTPRIVNATWAQNAALADSLGELIEVRGDASGADVQIANSIFWGNAARAAVGTLTGSVTIDSSIVEGGWDGSGAGVVEADPRYVNPAGADGTPGTLDDSLQVLGNSPALNQGGTSLLTADRGDLDADGNTTEAVAQGLGGAARVLAGQVDAGAYEGAESPSVVPTAATSVADSSATLAGAVVPYATSADVTVEVVPTSGGTVQTFGGPTVSGTDSVSVSVEANGLAPSTEYEYRLVADDGTRSTTSLAATFATTASGPVATADPASSVQDSSATLNGTVNPGGALARVYVKVQEGPTENVLLTPVDTLDTNLLSDQAVSLTTPDTLLPGTKYRYQIVAASSADSVTSAPETFVTDIAPPVARADSVTEITTSEATFYGTVNPGGGMADVWVRYYPSGQPSAEDTVAVAGGLEGVQDTSVSVSVRGLDSGTQYAVEAVATNGKDTTRSAELAFSTENAPPVAVNDTVQTQEDEPVTVSVLANDTADGTLAPATVTVVDSPMVGSVQADGETGTLTYAPGRNANGTDSLRYVVSDNAGKRSNEAAVVVQVAPVNDAPVARADTATVREGGSVSIPVLANDRDVEGRLDTASVAVVRGPDRGQVQNIVDGVLTYAPEASGQDSLRYRVADTSPRQAKADTATVRIEVREVALVAQPDTHRLGVAQVGQPGAVGRVNVENRGEVALTDLQVALEGDAPSSFRIATDSDETRLAPGEARTVRVRFRPDATGRVRATLAVRAAEGGVARTALIGRGARVAVQTNTLRREQRTEVDLVVEGGFKARSVRTLFVRRGGASAYRAVSLQGVDSTAARLQLRGRVPDTLVTARGVDYYAVLAGEAGLGGGRTDLLTLPAGGETEAQAQPQHLPVRFDSLRAPVVSRYSPETYQMVTVPAKPDNGIKAALRSGFGGRYDRTAWRLLRWNGAEGDYREYPQIDSLGAGDAFWLITETGEPPTLAMTGQTVQADTARQIPLQPGWNQVGSPYGYGVEWPRVFAASGLDSTSVDGPVGYRDSTYRRGVRVLKPWRGYFVFNATAETQTLVVPPKGAAERAKRKRLAAGPAALSGTQWAGAVSGGKLAGTKKVVDGTAPNSPMESLDETERDPSDGTVPTGFAGDGAEGVSSGASASGEAPPKNGEGEKRGGAAEGRPYTLRLEARSRTGRPSRVWIGLRGGAETGRGPLDFAQAPPIGDGVRLSVTEQVKGRAVAHAGSFKPPASGPDAGGSSTGSSGAEKQEGRGRSWSLVLRNRSEEAREVRLRMRREGHLPAGQSRYVLDQTGERRLSPGQSVEVGPGQERRLRVLVGTEAYARSESEVALEAYSSELRGNYPNPFRGETTIGYTLGTAQKVTLEIYDVLGRRVRTLVEGREQEAGPHQVRWEGENRYGAPVGSGVYFVRIRAEGITETQKMVLVR